MEVLEVDVGRGRLVLGDGVDEGVARAGVLHEEPTHPGGERPEVADRKQVPADNEENDGAGNGDPDERREALGGGG